MEVGEVQAKGTATEQATRHPVFVGPEAPGEKDLYTCVHCGLCLDHCPTYVVLGLETESPRGRIALMRAAHEGRVALTPTVLSHWNLCLQCRACEAVCPSGVPYGRLMEYTRAQVLRQRPGPWTARLLRHLVFFELLPHPRRLKFLAVLLRLYSRSGLQALVRGLNLLRPFPALKEAEASLPPLPSRFFEAKGQVYPARGQRKHRVVLLSGCVMPLFQGPTMENAVRVLTANGCEVVVPAGQVCCGALNIHGGERQKAREMARRNIDAFLATKPDYIITASAGCGSAMKEYPELLHDDPAYRAKAVEFSGKVRDVTEFLASIPLEPPPKPLPYRVTYQDACHLAHAQRIARAPRQVLQSIPGLEFVEMERSDLCCGAAGSYQVTQRKMSRLLLQAKMNAIARTKAGVIATANPGCALQLERGVALFGPKVRVCHIVDLLAEAYGGE